MSEKPSSDNERLNFEKSTYPSDLGDRNELLAMNIHPDIDARAVEAELAKRNLPILTIGDKYKVIINKAFVTEILEVFPCGIDFTRPGASSRPLGETIADEVRGDLLRKVVDDAFDSAGIK